ncbi:MAG TPA: hypothetical protein PKD85_14185, partial [Saprospiraceae bacterium]|nr:hypothetical protein [Saprospiraceae bacterium]
SDKATMESYWMSAIEKLAGIIDEQPKSRYPESLIQDRTQEIQADKWNSVMQQEDPKYLHEGESKFDRDMIFVAYDIDSVFGLSEEFPTKSSVMFTPFVPFTLMQNVIDIPFVFKGKENNLRSILTLPLCFLGTLNTIYVNICFPLMERKELTMSHSSVFFEKLLRPSLLQLDSGLHRLPVDIFCAMEKGRQNNGTLGIKAYQRPQNIMFLALKNMKKRKNFESIDSRFATFFFYVYSKGIKSLTKANSENDAVKNVEKILNDSGCDMLPTMVYDFAIEIYPKRKNETMVFKRKFLLELKSAFELSSRGSFDNYAQMNSVGGLRGIPFKKSTESSHLFFLLAYSIDKDIFTTRNGYLFDRCDLKSNDIPKLQRLQNSANYILEANQNQSFGCRLEFRISQIAALSLAYTGILQKLNSLFIKATCIHTFQTSVLFAYKKEKLNAYVAILSEAIQFQKKSNMDTDIEVHRFVALIKILLKSLFSAVRLNSYTKSLIGSKKVEKLAENELNIFNIIEQHNEVIIKKDFIEKRNYNLILSQDVIKIDTLMEKRNSMKSKEGSTYISNIKQELKNLERSKAISKKDSKWIFKDEAIAIHHIMVLFQKDIISMMPSVWFHDMPICLKEDKFLSKFKIEYKIGRVNHWERLFNAFFYPKKESCRWKRCDYYKLYHMHVNSLQENQRANQRAKVLKRFDELIEVLPFIDDTT